MANTADGVSWDITSPADNALVSNEPVEVRGLRTGVGSRLTKEHVAPAAASVGGEHLAGSAKAYYTGVTPANRPDGATALDNVATPTGDKGRLWVNGTTLSVWTGTAWVALNASSASILAAQLSESQATGTQGGSFTAGAYVTRALNAESDPGGIVTLAANQFNLGAGTYMILASAPAMRVNGHKIKLRNITDGTDSAFGTTEFSGSGGDYAETRSFLHVIVTIASGKTFEIQHRCETTSALSNARGRACGLSSVEVYTIVDIIKMS
jgi:hypothetical protein